MAEEKKFEHIVIEKVAEGNYAVISLNRPDKLNALTAQTCREVADALESMELDQDVRCVVIRGTKNVTKKAAFSSGADLTAPYPKQLKPNVPMHMDWAMFDRHRSYTRIEAFPKPLIAAVDGYAFGGGCELTLVCDLVIASKRSFFGFPEIVRGIFPANGGTQRMARHIGLGRTKWMIFTGERISAEDMYDWGYVSKLVDDDKFEEEVHKLASRIGKGATTAYYVIKKAMNYGTQVPHYIGVNFETLGFAVNSQASDVAEGINAFIKRREPEFKGI
jgi:enoyl-CoA hydratase/3-hydroxyacyl-CoA dehydrogenase